MLELLKRIIVEYHLLLTMMQVNCNSRHEAYVMDFLLVLLYLQFASNVYCVFLIFKNFVASKLGPYVKHTFDTRLCLCFVIDEEHAIPFEICSKERYLHL
jgi:hypothetical protein